MKNAILIVGGFVFGLLVAAGLSNTTNLFSDASQSGTELLDQVDQMMASSRFDDKTNVDRVVSKTTDILPLLPEGSQAHLVISYIQQTLIAKSKRMMPKPTPAPIPQPVETEVEEVEDVAAAAEAIEEEVVEEVEDVFNSAPSSNNYFGGFEQPALRGTAPTEPVDADTAKKVDWWNIWRQDIPEKKVRERKSYLTPEFKYIIDGKTYDSKCVQVESLNLCMEINNHNESMLSSCRTQSIAAGCLEMIEKKWQSALSYYEIQYNESMR